MSTPKQMRNVAVIAHVDHGKTTLMDQLLQACGVLDQNSSNQERFMDAHDLEKERGITILSKCTNMTFEGVQLNMVDTPGHADFGGEVERILDMVEGVLLLVDSSEGVMPQTKFVVSKALQQGLSPIVLINKMDKPDARPDEVYEEVFELLLDLGASDEQLDFPLLYCSAKHGWAVYEKDAPKENMRPILESIIKCVPPPTGDEHAPLQMLVTTIATVPFLGKVLTGRIHQGSMKEQMPVHLLDREGHIIEQGRLQKIFVQRGPEQDSRKEAIAGEIVSIAGLEKGTVTHTVAALSCTTALDTLPLDPPTLTMRFSVNDSPLSGREGSKLTSAMIYDRLVKEKEDNPSIEITRTGSESFQVAGRGLLHLSITIEKMRREGFELSVSPPEVIFQEDAQGKKLEPVEDVQLDIEEGYLGIALEKINKRHAEIVSMDPLGPHTLRVQFHAPTRCLIGLHNDLLMTTRGTAIMHRSFRGYEPYRGDMESVRNGVLVSLGQGKALAYALMNIEARGVLFIRPGDEVYEGMIIGEHSRSNDLPVNPLKGKKLTNMRASGSDKEVRLAAPRQMTLEEILAYVQKGEKIEVTPSFIRLRKA